ncbi:hypothetical protein, partial [Mesorhizobium sp.]|uniref:hypothetical protein n=1 Tax=Mesorhizobium sp. TaxID=1871066 RepID=UPI0025D786F2
AGLGQVISSGDPDDAAAQHADLHRIALQNDVLSAGGIVAFCLPDFTASAKCPSMSPKSTQEVLGRRHMPKKARALSIQIAPVKA